MIGLLQGVTQRICDSLPRARSALWRVRGSLARVNRWLLKASVALVRGERPLSQARHPRLKVNRAPWKARHGHLEGWAIVHRAKHPLPLETPPWASCGNSGRDRVQRWLNARQLKVKRRDSW